MLYPGAPLAIKYTTPAAIVAPMICEIQYPSASRALILLLTSMPKVTAGLMWQPETGPRAKAMAINASPNANATPTFPTWEPAITAVPTPAKTRTNVPNNSAAYFIECHLSKESNPDPRQYASGKFALYAATVRPSPVLNQCCLGRAHSTLRFRFWHH